MNKFKSRTSKLAVLAIGVLIAFTLSLVFSFNNGISAFAAEGESFEIAAHGRAHIL